jgi:hypothetical protein
VSTRHHPRQSQPCPGGGDEAKPLASPAGGFAVSIGRTSPHDSSAERRLDLDAQRPFQKVRPACCVEAYPLLVVGPKDSRPRRSDTRTMPSKKTVRMGDKAKPLDALTPAALLSWLLIGVSKCRRSGQGFAFVSGESDHIKRAPACPAPKPS